MVNSSGIFSPCELKCCPENLCDPYKVDVTTTTTVIAHPSTMTSQAPDVTRPSTQPTSAVSAFAASFGAILVAFVLNIFFFWNIFFYLQSHYNNDNYNNKIQKEKKKRKANKKKKISADLQDLRYKINYTTYNTTENYLLTQHYVP